MNTYLLFHSVVEVFSISIAWGILAIAWNSRYYLRHSFFLFLAVAYAAVGAIDLVHTVAYKGMGIFPEATANLPTQLWIAARYLGAASLVVAPIFLKRRISTRSIVLFFVAVTAALLAMIHVGWFPACFREGAEGLTSFKIVSEYVACAMVAAAMWLLWRQRAALETKVVRLLLASMAATIATELAFTLYTDVYGIFNILGHLLKIGSFVLLYHALIVTALRRPYETLFHDLHQFNAELEARVNVQTAEIRAVNETLEQRVADRTAALQVANESIKKSRTAALNLLQDAIANREQAERAEDALRELNASLEQRVIERTIEVQQKANQLRALASQLSQSEQRERRRLAKILHDHIQQLIVAARMQLAWMKHGNDPDRIQTAAQGVDAILHEALTASRSLTVDLCPPVLHDTGLIGALNWLATRMLEQNQFTVSLRADNEAEPNTEETRLLLFECVRELLFNAVKHASDSRASVTMLRTPDNRIKLTVADRGKGFDLNLLTERQSHEPTFGLFSVQERLAHIGGEMHIQSAPGKGTAITLIAPIGEPTPATAEQRDVSTRYEGSKSHAVQGNGQMIRALIVDDHKIMREGLRNLLDFESDIEVVGEAADGRHSIELVERLQPDVILMDINLGEMNGVEATRRILSRHPHIRIIGLSMHTDKDVANAMREAGAVAYLTKSGPSEDLIAAIRACAPEMTSFQVGGSHGRHV